MSLDEFTDLYRAWRNLYRKETFNRKHFVSKDFHRVMMGLPPNHVGIKTDEAKKLFEQIKSLNG